MRTHRFGADELASMAIPTLFARGHDGVMPSSGYEDRSCTGSRSEGRVLRVQQFGFYERLRPGEDPGAEVRRHLNG